ncbi:hypothetical protein PybrP1_001982 [[Pythium] brassicae (nom. inval.)]|nr:hypothetical protein PybrP1_001982 [[Pythium] brassicae (nom. inval.)]
MRGLWALVATAAALVLLLRLGAQPNPALATVEVVRGGYAAVDGTACEIANFEVLSRVAIVYTWVNGSEPCYNARRQRAGLSPGGSSRDKEMGELKYSIRSLLKFAPWLTGPIYIVSPGQIPDWLDTAAQRNPRIRVVDQDALLPRERVALPNFDTNVIEQFLHRIPGLTDIFVHMNDDYVFVKPVAPQRLFTCDGGLRFLTEINHIRHVKGQRANAWLASVRNTVELADATYGGQHVYNFLKHAPFVYSRRAFARIHDKFAPALRATHAHQLRHFEDLNMPLLHQIYMVEEGAQLLGIPVAFNPLDECDDWLLVRVTDDNHAGLEAHFERALAQRGPEVLFALNDEYTKPETAALVRRFYAALLPEAAPHELPDGQSRAIVSNYHGPDCAFDPSVLPALPEVAAPASLRGHRAAPAALFQDSDAPRVRAFRRFFSDVSSADASLLTSAGFVVGLVVGVACAVAVVRVATDREGGLFAGGGGARSKSR